MRRIGVIALGIMVVLGLAGPADAGKPTKDRTRTLSANAFWYEDEPMPGGLTRTSVWYVGAYIDRYGTFSDLYHDVYVCDAAAEECTSESSSFGYRDHLSASEFSMDADGLTFAHFDAVYDLQTYDENWDPIGDPVPTHIVADLTGSGDLMKGKGGYFFKSKCFSYRETFKQASRQATATGSVDGVDLGTTDDAWMSSGVSRYLERFSC